MEVRVRKSGGRRDGPYKVLNYDSLPIVSLADRLGSSIQI
jgi:hypothetical protein